MSGPVAPPLGDPLRDPARLREIAELGLHSAHLDPILQRIAGEAADLAALPIGLISVVLDGAQFFAAMHGLSGWMREARGTPVEWSFCAVPVRTREPFVVEDATTHPLARDNPLVQRDGIRCCVAVPLISSRGYAVGALCALGAGPCSVSAEGVEEMQRLAERAVEWIEARRDA